MPKQRENLGVGLAERELIDRERRMVERRIRQARFPAVHALIHNHFNQDRHFNRRDIFNQIRSAALAEWRQLAA